MSKDNEKINEIENSKANNKIKKIANIFGMHPTFVCGKRYE